MKRYCGRRSGNVYEQMASLKQLGSVAEYVEEYKKGATRLSTMSEDQQLGFFMNGLQAEIKWQVRIHDPEDLHRAIQLALDIEEELIEEEGGRPQYRTPTYSSIESFKGGWSSGGSGSGRFKKDVGSGRPLLTTVGPKQT